MQLSEIDNGHPLVILTANDTVSPTVTSKAYMARDMFEAKKSYVSSTFRGNIRRIYIAVYCPTIPSCAFGITGTYTLIPQYYDEIGYVRGITTVFNGYQDRYTTELLHFQMCFDVPIVEIGVQTIYTTRDFKSPQGT